MLAFVRLFLRSPAKVNLFFAIHGLRSDGYCDITSLMAPITLHDTLCYDFAPGPQTVNIISPQPLSFDRDNNTITQAIQCFRNATGFETLSLISIRKNIPTGAGFGGGSSNAVSTLKALNNFYGNPIHDLSPLAQQIGMDGPFFLKNQFQLATQRGEQLEGIAVPPSFYDYHLLVFCPALEIHTPDMYRLFKEKAHYEHHPFLPTDDIESLCYNVFESLVLEIYPSLKALFTLLQKHQFHPHLTGSGSGGFILDQKRSRLQEAQMLIQEAMPDYRLCEVVDFIREPYSEIL